MFLKQKKILHGVESRLLLFVIILQGTGAENSQGNPHHGQALGGVSQEDRVLRPSGGVTDRCDVRSQSLNVHGDELNQNEMSEDKTDRFKACVCLGHGERRQGSHYGDGTEESGNQRIVLIRFVRHPDGQDRSSSPTYDSVRFLSLLTKFKLSHEDFRKVSKHKDAAGIVSITGFMKTKIESEGPANIFRINPKEVLPMESAEVHEIADKLKSGTQEETKVELIIPQEDKNKVVQGQVQIKGSFNQKPDKLSSFKNFHGKMSGVRTQIFVDSQDLNFRTSRCPNEDLKFKFTISPVDTSSTAPISVLEIRKGSEAANDKSPVDVHVKSHIEDVSVEHSNNQEIFSRKVIGNKTHAINTHEEAYINSFVEQGQMSQDLAGKVDEAQDVIENSRARDKAHQSKDCKDNFQQRVPTGTQSPIITDVLIDAGREGVAECAALVGVRNMDDDASADAMLVNRPKDLHPPRVFIRPGKAGAASVILEL